jgi:hypothetical protein
MGVEVGFSVGFSVGTRVAVGGTAVGSAVAPPAQASVTANKTKTADIIGAIRLVFINPPFYLMD